MARVTTVTTWWLEQTSPSDLSPARAPGAAAGLTVALAEVASPEFSRFLYTAVGGDVTWTDRLPWSHARWLAHLDRPGVETWVAWVRGTPAGFAELDGSEEGMVELAYFGLLPAFRGRGIGGQLLSVALARAWDLGERLPSGTPTRRVWVHTCSLDGPHALANYRRRGFRLYDTTEADQPLTATPGPWPGAFDPQ
ncbi:GNAT family N-acetyltransferase [Streptomyces sp. PT12]|uniref:GNAT family N-acetyltransferase n=1 Tax=Streptomyces sp. PT12 TaxID=1510197 RepID=UPI000DE26CD2|nr:GNAT family N-acetyltransferase [Streptomyces sp. PT12]RBM20873.1 GNAT family N-acetyltransferase [Streptomyces sp. PT12]